MSGTHRGLPSGGGDGTHAVRAGLPEPVKYEPTLPGPVFAAHYHAGRAHGTVHLRP